MEWIKLEERWPEIGVGVLITDGEMIGTAQRCKPFSSYKKLRWGGWGFEGYEWDWELDINSITYWMPLPELPKKEK